MTNALIPLWKIEKKSVIFENKMSKDKPSTINSQLSTPQRSLLRLFTAGSVDDGKSTLIGRLLYDTKSIFEDQYEAIKQTTEQRGEQGVNLALLTDGLKAEREQGITIDVAYRYFSTPQRKFIIADTPGHIQYTRNMVTGSSSANLAIILIDARHGITEQTCRHSLIASLIGIKHVVVCINKMDLVGYKKEVFERIRSDYEAFSSKLQIVDVQFIPISALGGDNVVDKSAKMPWYEGSTLLYLLENIHVAGDENMIDCRFPVQYVVRPQSKEHHDYRGYAGKVAGGIFKKGDSVMALPSGLVSNIKSIETADEKLEEAEPGMSVTILLEDDIDISRGDMLVRENNQPSTGKDIDIMLCWLNEKKLVVGGKYAIKHTTHDAHCIVKDIQYKININTLHRIEDDKQIGLNDIGRISIRTTRPLFFDNYRKNRHTGSLILIDEATNETVGAGMII
jgi:sulfate adenylyltransferase subunit 1